MANRLLQKGDIIRLEKGMTVYSEIPKKYLFSNCPFDEGLTKTNITIGNTYVRREIAKENVVNSMFGQINYIAPAPIEKVVEFVDSLGLNLGRETFDTSFMAGTYTVLFALYDGGSHNFKDSYPDGWHVFCQNNDNGTEVDFYQSGNFTAMIPEITPINK